LQDIKGNKSGKSTKESNKKRCLYA